ncbi:hypothetical protein V6N11_026887 [Hibiscus sabdariffa]|uniref:Reverse transcriptase zinc-binding domain-containing protein n=1 Tax=Hibiscus sabdariffa TaxID=183260 RepID=A0ABR2SX05_9ROSI
MEEEGTRSTSERLSSSSMATKIVASEPNREQTMENVQLIHASRRTESIVSGKEVVSMGESSMATIGDNCALKTVAAPEKGEKNGISLVPWSVLQSSVDDGGFGFKDMYQHNRAFLMKVGYQFMSMSDTLWVKGLGSIWEVLTDCISWNIRDGKQTDFWYDNWLNSYGRLVFQCVNDTCPRPGMVVDMITNEGQRNWSYLQRWLPTEILDSIATVPPPATHYGADTPGWRWSDKREFSVGSTYSVLMGAEAQNRNPICKEVWSLKVPQRIRTFMWLTLHDRHLTNVERARRHLAVSDRCTLCFSGSEDMNHVLRFCTCARELWNVVIKQEVLTQFYELPYDVWLRCNLQGSGIMAGLSMDWRMQFSIYCWLLWKRRCSMIFDANHVDHDSVLAKGQHLISECEVTTLSRITPNTVNRVTDKLAALGRTQSMSGLIYATLPSLVAALTEEDRRRWEAYGSITEDISQCSRRVDPGGTGAQHNSGKSLPVRSEDGPKASIHMELGSDDEQDPITLVDVYIPPDIADCIGCIPLARTKPCDELIRRCENTGTKRHQMLIVISYWALWHARNEIVHEGRPFSAVRVSSFIFSFLFELESSIAVPAPNLLVKDVKWFPPDENIIKLNFDAPFNTASKSSVSRIVARDSHGFILAACTCPHLGIADAFIAEAVACEKAVSFALDLGFRSVQIEGDSLSALSATFATITFSFVGRTGNVVAHELAQVGLQFPEPRYWIEEAPPTVEQLAQRDCLV